MTLVFKPVYETCLPTIDYCPLAHLFFSWLFHKHLHILDATLEESVVVACQQMGGYFELLRFVLLVVHQPLPHNSCR